MREGQRGAMAGVAPARREGLHGWQCWAPYAALAWSLGYGVLAVYWAVSGYGFPYTPEALSDDLGPMLGRFGPGVAWIVVALAGIPAAAVAAAMLRGGEGRTLQPFFTTAGALLALILLLLMTGLNLLVLFGYIPFVLFSLLTSGTIGHRYLEALTRWTVVHQLLCLIGGFLWLAATVAYRRKSAGACVYCGRRDDPSGWQTPERAARWGRIAVYVSMVAPVFYAVTRYAWALGFPLGMGEQASGSAPQRGAWIAGLALATFGLVGVALTLGLVQRWGETFPRWMIGLAGRRVPAALAVIPASFVSVLLVAGGVVVWSLLGGMIARMEAAGAGPTEIVSAVVFGVGGVLLFPVWGIALAVATLAYYYRRRSPCGVCGRGAPIEGRDGVIGGQAPGQAVMHYLSSR